MREPDLPDDDCFVLPISGQSDACVSQWWAFEDQCMWLWEYRYTDDCDLVKTYVEGWDEWWVALRQNVAAGKNAKVHAKKKSTTPIELI